MCIVSARTKKQRERPLHIYVRGRSMQNARMPSHLPRDIGHMLAQLLLQEVAWDEDSRGRMRAERAAVVAQYDAIGDLQHEPLFCAETALKVDRALTDGSLLCTICHARDLNIWNCFPCILPLE
jgi:hypothetical protein